MASTAVRVAFLLTATLSMAACMGHPAPPAPPVQPASAPAEPVFSEVGKASWYGKFHQGRTTASGDKFDMNDLTAAHRTLPLGTEATVTNLENGRSVDVVVNDRGPYRQDRVIDLSKRAAETLGIKDQGVGKVKIEVMPKDDGVETATIGN
jgi:rare lipoprotein A